MARLEAVGVDVAFGAVQVLSGVDLRADGGQVTGLVGPPGAGKTTLFEVLTGRQAAQAGCVTLDGHDISAVAAHRRAQLGIAHTFRRPDVLGGLTVRENLLVAAEVGLRWSHDGGNPHRVVEAVIGRVGLQRVALDRCDTLPAGVARLVDVGRALATNPRVLLMDEPSSGLDEQETDHLGGVLGELAEDAGLAVVVFESDVEVMTPVAGTIHVLDGGRIVAVGSPSQVVGIPA